MGKTKVKLFKRWLHENEDASLVLAPVAERMSNRELMAAIKNLEAAGYALDERGVPIGLDDADNRLSIVLALHESFEKVLGYPLLDWYFEALGEKIFEESKPLLDKFRKWLIDVSESAEEQEWWQTIKWEWIKYEVLSFIVDYLEMDGYPINEDGVPTPLNEKDAEGLWGALEANILGALIRFALEVRYESEEE